MESLGAYRDWLESEAIPAGGMGPDELDRLDERHIGDSLLFLPFLPVGGPILDAGSGVGLPGIPLAIVRPDLHFILLDRSERRADLLRRALRVLAITNAEVAETDIGGWNEPVPGVVSRATIPPDAFLPALPRLLLPGGIAVLGGSWTSKPMATGYEIKEIDLKVLAQPVWLLIMRQT